MRRRYEFEVAGRSTGGLPRAGTAEPYVGTTRVPRGADHERGEYAGLVRRARGALARRALLGGAPRHTLFPVRPSPPPELLPPLRAHTPSPHGSLLPGGDAESLVRASP